MRLAQGRLQVDCGHLGLELRTPPPNHLTILNRCYAV